VNIEELRAAAETLKALASGIPDNWPAQCILNFHEEPTRNESVAHHIGYLCDGSRGPGLTIGDYRLLANALPALLAVATAAEKALPILIFMNNQGICTVAEELASALRHLNEKGTDDADKG